jgi:hypothetical protein
MVQGSFKRDGWRRMVVSWVEGAPEKSLWKRAKVPPGNGVPVGTYCCSTCGFLESYARPEFAAE